MSNHTSILKAVLVASCLAGFSAAAVEPEIVMPDHTLNSLKKTVRSAEAVMLATVLAEPAEGPNASVKVRVDQSLLGNLPAELELPLDGFFPGDLQKDAQVLVGLRFDGKQKRWVCTGLYDMVVNGRIRDIPVGHYLSLVSTESQRFGTERARRAERRALAAGVGSPVTPPAAQPTTASVQPGT